MAESTQTENPFVKMFSGIAAPWCGIPKQTVAQYLPTPFIL